MLLGRFWIEDFVRGEDYIVVQEKNWSKLSWDTFGAREIIRGKVD